MNWVILLLGAVILALVVVRTNRASTLPPGPRGLPILGNALDIPLQNLFLKLDSWGKDYDGIYTLKALHKKIIVLTSADVAAEILDSKGVSCSDRPHFVKMSEVMTGGLMFTSLSSSARWRRMRGVTSKRLRPVAAEAYYPIQEDEATHLVLSLVDNPEQVWSTALKHVTASIIWRSLGNLPFEDDKLEGIVRHAESTVHAMMKASNPASLIEIFPILKYTPAWAAEWKRYSLDFFGKTDAFLATLFGENLQHQDGFRDLSPEEARWTAGTAFLAGFDTTVVAVENFLLAMLLHPDVAKKAQQEMDTVLGDRRPTFRDRESLPYVQAIVKETLRWRPPVPSGVPHVANEDFTYKEYVIPKGTLIIGNIWSMNRDRAVFSYPDVFDPERYLDEKGQLKTALPNFHEDFLAYGHGRRRCPAAHFANNSVYILATHLLYAFDLLKAKDPKGVEVTPDANAYLDRGTTVATEFQCVFQPRRDLDGLRGSSKRNKATSG